MWTLLTLCSAVLLGFYDVSKKSALKNNAVVPVLFYSTVCSAVIFIVVKIMTHHALISAIPPLPGIDINTHLKIVFKSVIVGASWTFSYIALKNLPITIVTPIRSTSPVWTLAGAMLIFHEQPNYLQWTGMLITFVFFYLFSIAGKREGIHFRKNKFIYFLLLATIIGAASGLYDKYMITQVNRYTLQIWFSIYMPLVILPMYLLYLNKRLHLGVSTAFTWRWSIPLIGVLLSMADFMYFYALSFDDALISIISIIRRGNVLISFSVGAFLFKDINIQRKALLLAGILAGIVIIILASK